MKKVLLPITVSAFLICPAVLADEDLIKKAMSAGPEAIAKTATIMLPDGTVLREGSDFWTCFPHFRGNVDSSPICADPDWTAVMLGETVDGDWRSNATGFSYMLAGDYPHLMVFVPNEDSLKGFNTDPADNKTWVMDFPAPHFMIPVEMKSGDEEEMADDEDE